MTAAWRVGAPEPLGPGHVVDGFSCGSAELDEWLVKHARQSHAAGSSRTHVVCQGGRVVGFHSLAAGDVRLDELPDRIARGMSRHPVPVVVLTRLAVDQSAHGHGMGAGLLRDVFHKVAEVSQTIGVRALMVHAKDTAAREWYLSRVPFAAAPSDPLQLFLLVKDLRAAIR